MPFSWSSREVSQLKLREILHVEEEWKCSAKSEKCGMNNHLPTWPVVGGGGERKSVLVFKEM